MKRNVRWLLPVTAAVAMVVGMSSMSARAADEKAAGKGTISGTVVDKDGKGVADVEVRVMKPGMGRGGRGPGGPGGPGGAEGKKPAEQSTIGQNAQPLQAEGHKPKEGAGGQGGQGGRPEPVATGKTDADGKFTIKDVPAGEYGIGVRDMEKKVYGIARVTVKADETATVEIKTSDTPPQRRGPGGPGGGQGGAGGNGGGGAK